MNVRTALLAGILALPGNALQADELQVTYIGQACPISILNCTASEFSPFTITYDVNTTSGQQTSVILPPFQPFPPVESFLSEFQATNLSVLNFSAIVGGNTVESLSSTSGHFSWFAESSPGTAAPWAYDFNASAGSIFGSNGFALSNVTGDQFQELSDPLAYMLLNAPHLGGGFGHIPGWHLSGLFTITPVPTPGILPLFFTGLAGLALSFFRNRRRRNERTG